MMVIVASNHFVLRFTRPGFWPNGNPVMGDEQEP